MFYFTSNGKDDLKTSYPAKISWFKSIFVAIVQYLSCYLNCAIAMTVIYHDDFKSDYFYYYVNLISILCIIYLLFVLILLLITNESCTIIMDNDDESGKSVIMSGKYKIGIFRRGSFLRHCIVNPIIDGLLYATVITITIAFTDIPKTYIVDPKCSGYTLLATWGYEFILGFVRVKAISNGEFWSREVIIRPVCFGKESPNASVSHSNKEMPQEEQDDLNIIDSGPYYRSFIV